jgi:hypothetical protein
MPVSLYLLGNLVLSLKRGKWIELYGNNVYMYVKEN